MSYPIRRSMALIIVLNDTVRVFTGNLTLGLAVLPGRYLPFPQTFLAGLQKRAEEEFYQPTRTGLDLGRHGHARR